MSMGRLLGSPWRPWPTWGGLYFRLRLHRIRLPRWVGPHRRSRRWVPRVRPRVRYGALGFGTVVAFLLGVTR